MEELKSLRPCKCVLILSFLIKIIISTSDVDVPLEIANQNIIADLPDKEDLPRYFVVLKNAIYFFVTHKYYVDLNLQFGLFLVDMNLRPLLQQGRDISNRTRFRTEKLLEQLNELTNYYYTMVQENINVAKIGKNKKLALLFFYAWPEDPDAFNTEMLNRTRILSREELMIFYEKWEDYYFRVFDVEDNKPTPSEADECIAQLVRNDVLRRSETSQLPCIISAHCRRVLLGDNEFGYGLTHRVLLMVIARFAEKCDVFTDTTDKIKVDTFCKKCFNEAEYIAYNDFHLPDLMFEQIALCSLFGHAQFIRKHWLKTLLGFQTSVGCFSEKLATGDFKEEKLRSDENTEWHIERPSDIIYGQCNGHFTAVAMATLSSALRYIIETNYF